MQNPQTIPVFEILSGDEGVEEVDAIFAFEGYDLAAGSANVGVDVEGFPEVVGLGIMPTSRRTQTSG
jgi:hypothetical protein